MIKTRQSKIWLIAGILFVSYLIVISSIIHIESNAEYSTIKKFYDGIWYTIVTWATVGYGDMYLTTNVGKVLGLLLVLSCLVVVNPIRKIIKKIENEFLINKGV